MKISPASRFAPGKVRSAFSLVELMVVTVIVVILAGLVAGVVVKAIDASRTTATLTTMEIIKTGLNKQVQEIVDTAKKSPDATPATMYAKLRQAFPATIEPKHPTVPPPPGPLLLGEAKRGCTITSLLAYPTYESSIPTTLVVDLSTLDKDKKVIEEQKLKSILLRLILEKGPKSKVEIDQLPKGAMGQINFGGFNYDAVLDSWGDPIGVDIQYKNQSSGETAKPVITVSSLNAVMKN
jgi:prepilin-type N-terminal cleavage/methylation domain-containing protein